GPPRSTLLSYTTLFRSIAPRNPWGADTLEWAVAMPVTSYNFISLPDIRSRHPLWHNTQLPLEIEEGKHAMACIRHERRETWGSDAVTGRVREVIHLPTNSWIPLQAGVVLAVVCLSLLT